MTDSTIDLAAASTYADGHPHELYTRLRDQDPVHWQDGPGGRAGYWAVMRHADVRFVNMHDDLFSHAPSSQLEHDGEYTSGGVSLVNMDPPSHTAVRKVAVPDFLPGAVRARMPAFEQIAAQLVDEVIERGECDLVPDIAGRMASYVTAAVLAIPRQDAVDLYRFVEISLAGTASTPEQVSAAFQAMYEYGRGVYADRLANPGDDVLSRLAHADVGGVRISEADWLAHFRLLVVGAGDTTRHLIAGGMLALLEHPDQREALAADLHTLMPTAVEEMLRWVTPVIYNRRMAKSDCTIGATSIRAGDKLALYYGSANRDEDVFDDPFRFDVRRTPNDHVAFSGVGSHFCLGAHIARAEAAAIFKQILSRMLNVTQLAPVTYDASNMVSGPSHLRISFTPGPRAVAP